MVVQLVRQLHVFPTLVKASRAPTVEPQISGEIDNKTAWRREQLVRDHIEAEHYRFRPKQAPRSGIKAAVPRKVRYRAVAAGPAHVKIVGGRPPPWRPRPNPSTGGNGGPTNWGVGRRGDRGTFRP